MKYPLSEKMMSTVFRGVQAGFTGGRRSINPLFSSHSTLISLVSAAVVQDTLQKWIYSRAIKEMPFTADVNQRGWSEATGLESSPQDKVGGSNECIGCQRAGAFWSERLVWKLDVSASYVKGGKKKTKTPTAGVICPTEDVIESTPQTKTLSGCDREPALPTLRF